MKNRISTGDMTIDVIHSIPAPEAIDQLLTKFYNIPCSEVFLLHHGFNDTYNAGEFVLRVYRKNWRSVKNVASELEILIHLRNQAISVSAPLPTYNGDLFIEIDAPEGIRHAALFSKAPGNTPKILTSDLCAKIGHLLGKLHSAMKSKVRDRHSVDMAFLVDRPLENLSRLFPQYSNTLKNLGHLYSELKETVAGFNPATGFVHGDFIPTNMFQDPQYGLTVFDFDFCGTGIIAYDLATILNSLQYYEGGDRESLISAYESETSYKHSKTLLDSLEKIRELWTWGINLQCPEDFRIRNPHSFEHRSKKLLSLFNKQDDSI